MSSMISKEVVGPKRTGERVVRGKVKVADHTGLCGLLQDIWILLRNMESHWISWRVGLGY